VVSTNYEHVYLNDHAAVPALKAGLREYYTQYNTQRHHQALGIAGLPMCIMGGDMVLSVTNPYRGGRARCTAPRAWLLTTVWLSGLWHSP